MYSGPLLQKDGEQFNRHWGNLSRAGLNDKSQFTRQIEKYSDIYTSRVANLTRSTPYMYFRCSIPPPILPCPMNWNVRDVL